MIILHTDSLQGSRFQNYFILAPEYFAKSLKALKITARTRKWRGLFIRSAESSTRGNISHLEGGRESQNLCRIDDYRTHFSTFFSLNPWKEETHFRATSRHRNVVVERERCSRLSLSPYLSPVRETRTYCELRDAAMKRSSMFLVRESIPREDNSAFWRFLPRANSGNGSNPRSNAIFLPIRQSRLVKSMLRRI